MFNFINKNKHQYHNYDIVAKCNCDGLSNFVLMECKECGDKVAFFKENDFLMLLVDMWKKNQITIEHFHYLVKETIKIFNRNV